MTQQTENKWDKLDWLKGSDVLPAGTPAPLAASKTSTTTIPYKPRFGILLLGLILLPLAGWWMMRKAQTNDRGLIINGIIPFGTTGATWFYWTFAGICFAAAAAYLLFLLPQFFIRRQIVLEEDAITLPSWGFSQRHYRLPLHEIEIITLSQYDKYRFLKIRHAGKSYSVNSSWLPHNADMDTIVEWLATRGITFPTGV